MQNSILFSLGSLGYELSTLRQFFNAQVQWSANGVAICTANNYQYGPNLIGDDAGGAIITWDDKRSGFYDIYAQRVDANGKAL